MLTPAIKRGFSFKTTAGGHYDWQALCKKAVFWAKQNDQAIQSIIIFGKLFRIIIFAVLKT